MRKQVGVVFIIGLFIFAGFACSETESDKIIATVEGENITVKDFRERLDSSVMPAARNNIDIKNQILDSMIINKLIYNIAVGEGYDKDPEILKKLEAIRETMIDQIYVEKKVLKNIGVTDKEVSEYYNEHEEEFNIPERVRASHILIRVPDDAAEDQKRELEQKAEKILARIKAGEKLSVVAGEVSDCPSSKRGGDLSFFAKGQMVPEFEDTAFSLKTGEVSEVIETRFGYHIIEVTDRLDSEKMDFNEYKDRIKEGLLQKKRSQVLKQWVDKVKSEADIKINHDIIEKLKVDSGSEHTS